MKFPGAFLQGMRVCFSRQDPQNPSEQPQGSRLQAGSPLCQKCYMKGYHYSTSTNYAAEQLSVKTAYELAVVSDPPSRGTEMEKREHASKSARLCILRASSEGDLVYLEDAIEVYRTARTDVELTSVSPKQLRETVIKLMEAIGTQYTDVEFATFTSAETRSTDGRKKSVYLMPSVVTHVQHATMHQRALKAEAQLAALREEESKKQEKKQENQRNESGCSTRSNTLPVGRGTWLFLLY